MKKLVTLFAGIATLASIPAFAGPNWRIIHDERRDALLQAEHCAKAEAAALQKHKSMLSSSKSSAVHS